MKLLFDHNLSHKLVGLLKDLFPESSHVRLLKLESSPDLIVWMHAKKQGFTLVTQDEDFYNISLIQGFPPKVIWLRCGNQPTSYYVEKFKAWETEIKAFNSDDASGCLEIYS